MIGRTISHYQITDRLGQGGMGVVYKAQDTKLDRSVALKFLSTSALPTDDDKARFHREAKAAAKLNHAHIATVYEIDETDEGQAFIAMEYVEGETLAEKIKRGPLKLQEAITIATQVAEGLQAAHERGVVHRDIKSSNVMLTERGQVKVMDFGLAKTEAATMLTKEGTALGTVAYMSPEQARGEEVDHRTDLWSLGVVLYEMIVGRLPFAGDYEQAVVYSILNEDSEALTGLRTGVPMALERVVGKLLMKDRSLRYQHVDEVAVDLRAVDVKTAGLSQTAAVVNVEQAEKSSQARWKPMLPWGLFALMGVVATSVIIWNFSGPGTAPPRASRLTITVPSEQGLRQGNYLPIAISPDGRQYVMVVDRVDSPSQLYLRSLDDFEVVPLPGTEDGIQPFFSPDGQWVGFWADGALYKVSVKGGPPIKICDVPIGFRGASWGAEDTIILGGANIGLSRVSTGGGAPVVITNPDRDRGEEYHAYPEVLPGGREVLFTIHTTGAGEENSDIGVLSLETGNWRILQGMQGAIQPRYLDSGHLVYVRGGGLFAMRFDARELKPISSSTPVMTSVHTRFYAGLDLADFAVSRTGSLAYVSAEKKESQLVFVDRQGGQQPLTMEPSNLRYRPTVSPDGEQLAVNYNPDFGSSDVWILDLERGTFTPLTTDAPNIHPVWTPDGSRVTFASFKSGSFNLYWKLADGSAEAEPLLTRAYDQNPESWSPDGEILAFSELNPDSGSDIWILHRDSVRVPEPVVVTPSNERSPAFSPDGGWLAYASDESGRYEVYVQPYPGPGRRWPISTNGGQEPVWSPTENELYYRAGDSMMVVATDPLFTAGVPRSLFEWRFQSDESDPYNTYDVTPDGKQFVMVRGNQEALVELNIILNWFEELERLVPPGN